MNRGAKRLALGTMVAGIAGYLAGVLTAPKSGRETRKSIKLAGSTSIREAEKQLKSIHTELNQLLDRAQNGGAKTKHHDSSEYDSMLGHAQDAKHKVREVLSALHEGDADDKDLQKAVKEATKAIKHIKSFIKK